MLQTSGYVGVESPRNAQDSEPRRTGSVPLSAGRVTATVDQLDATVKELYERLVTVLSARPGAGAVKSDAKCSQPCELATYLDATADRIEVIGHSIRDIIERLEV